MRLCYICSPYRGNIFKRIRNIRYAKRLTALALRLGYTPITPHLFLTRVLNDNDKRQRDLGLKAGLNLLEPCTAIMIGCKYGISEGMRGEIKKAEGKQIIKIDWRAERERQDY